MALSDIPKIPREYKPRVDKLSEKIRAKEITIEEVLANLLTVLGKVTIDSNGIRTEGDYGSFEVDERGIAAGQGFLLNAYEILPVIRGKQFLIKRGSDFKKIKIGLGLKESPATEADIKNPRLPIVEIIDKPANIDVNSSLQEPASGLETLLPEIKIHRIEEFAGWFGDSWKEASKIFKLSVPVSELLTKEILVKLGEPMAPFCDQVLQKCGV